MPNISGVSREKNNGRCFFSRNFESLKLIKEKSTTLRVAQKIIISLRCGDFRASNRFHKQTLLENAPALFFINTPFIRPPRASRKDFRDCGSVDVPRIIDFIFLHHLVESAAKRCARGNLSRHLPC